VFFVMAITPAAAIAMKAPATLSAKGAINQIPEPTAEVGIPADLLERRIASKIPSSKPASPPTPP